MGTEVTAGLTNGLGARTAWAVRPECGRWLLMLAGLSLAMLSCGCNVDVPFSVPVPQLKDDSIDTLAEALRAIRDRQDPGLRYEAYNFLGDPELYEEDQQSKQEVVEILGLALKFEQDTQNRIAVVRALGRLGAAKSLEALEPLAEDKDPSLRAAVCYALGQIGGDRAVAKLDDVFVSDKNLDVRLAAASALGRLPGRRSAAVLLDGLSDPDIAIQYRCRQSLARMIGSDHGSDLSAWRTAVQQADFTQRPEPAKRFWLF